MLPPVSTNMFDNIIDSIDEDYPFSLSPKLILALLVTVDICVIALGKLFIWYKRKATLSSSSKGNLIKLVPSLAGNNPSLDSLLPMLSELASSRTRSRTTPTTISCQAVSNELILPPVLVPRLQAAPSSPSTSTAQQPVQLLRGPINRNQRSKCTSEGDTAEPCLT